MSETPRRPILFKGELYSEPISKSGGGRTKEPDISFDEARAKVISDLDTVRNSFYEMPRALRMPNEVVLCLRMKEDFSAKSYYPDGILDAETSRFGLKDVGSRRWTSPKPETSSKEMKVFTTGKLFFVRATDKNLAAFSESLNKAERSHSRQFALDVRRISSIDILKQSEQILGLPETWNGGRLEAVLHPFEIDRRFVLSSFLELIASSGVDADSVRSKQYGQGVTFLSFVGDRKILDAIAGFNPLRTVHPLLMRDLPIVERGQVIIGGPQMPIFKKKSQITVGVIDGGTEPSNPYLSNYVDLEDCINEPEHPRLVQHGTQVCGAVLYGPLNPYANGDLLPEPALSVKSFRVLSRLTNDPDLYDAIDAIETIVPENPDIKVYNLSFGPKGPILDDSISRFTFSCDWLSKSYEVLFCVAVGNDGHVNGYDRIQSPSDAVNSLAVGAFTKRNGSILKAPYSCIGPGREGSKLKPDLLAFGGCDQTPIHLVGSVLGQKIWNYGTSFASPLVARAAGLLIGGAGKNIDSLICRALIVHSVNEKTGAGHSISGGHGILPEDVNEVVTCPEKSYTLIYKGEIEAGKYAQFEIPWVKEIASGKVKIRWTMAVLSDVDPHSPDDYTSSSIDVVFYPHRNKYSFEKEIKSKKKHKLVNIETEKSTAAALKADGWKRPGFPVSQSGKSHKTEAELKLDLKWDSLDTREVSKQASNLHKPMLHLHALGRGSFSTGSKVKYALVVTMEAPDASFDLYPRILAEYNALVPLKLQIEIPVNVPV